MNADKKTLAALLSVWVVSAGGSPGGGEKHVQIVGKLGDDALQDFSLVHQARHLPKPCDLGLVHGNLNKTNRKFVLALTAGHEKRLPVLSLLNRNLVAGIAVGAVRHNRWLNDRFGFGLPRGFGNRKDHFFGFLRC